MISLALALAAASCGDQPMGETPLPGAPTCSDIADLPTADTIIGAKVDGRPLLFSSTSPQAGIRLNATGTRLTLIGRSGGDAPIRDLQIDLDPFHGVGGYGLRTLGGSDAIYHCDGGPVGGYRAGSLGPTPDSVWVTSYDSGTGQIEGAFSFLGHAPIHGGSSGQGEVSVTEGTFKGAVVRPPAAPTCADVVDAPTPDTLIGARVDGRMVLAQKGSPQSSVAFYPAGSNNVLIFGWRFTDTLAQILDLRIYGLHGVGGYPIADGWDPGTAWATYGCGHLRGDPPTLHDDVGYFPQTFNVPGDSVWVTSWDSVSGHLTGTYSFHTSHPAGDSVVMVTDGTFDVIVSH